MSKNKTLLILLAILIFGFILRVMYLPRNVLTFGYDQARDAFITQQILSGDLKILGPPASAPGLFHGVLYYYVLVPAYMFGKNPIIAAYWISLLNILGAITIFFLTKLFTKKSAPALLAAFLYAISFEAVQYATWLSNPTIGIWTVPLMYLGLWLWVSEIKAPVLHNFSQAWAPVLTAIGLGLSIQAEIFLLYHAVPLLIWLTVARKKINLKQFITFLIILLLSLSTMILAETKFGFKGIGGALSLLASEESIRGASSLGDFLLLFLNQLGKVFAFSTYPGNIGYGATFILMLIAFSVYKSNKKTISWQPFLATWLFSHITIVSVGGTSTPFLLVGIAPAVSILLAIWIHKWWGSTKIVAIFTLIAITYGNISTIIKENSHGSTIFSIQKDMLLSKQLSLIDKTYELSNSENFSINSLTSPLWINTVWSYLYNWYGQENFGYLPEYHGRDQVGRLGNNLMPASEDTVMHFLILEPMAGIPQRYLSDTVGFENTTSKLVNDYPFGELILQERKKI